MTYILKTMLACCLCLSAYSLSATKFAIIESQSFHAFHTMDTNWQNAIAGLGHEADILPQSALGNISALDNYEVLIVSSALIQLSATQQNVINSFASSGRPVYIQSEFMPDHPGNLTFKNIVNYFGGTFTWDGYETGNITPLTIQSPISERLNNVYSTSYFWYGAYGTGDANITAFMTNPTDGNDYAFIYETATTTPTVLITVADQDWVRTSNDLPLLENIIDYLAASIYTFVAPTVLIETVGDVECEGDTHSFTAAITDSIPEIILEWTINGETAAGENNLNFSTDALVEGDVVECILRLSNNADYTHTSNPILIAPMLPLEEVTVLINTDTTNVCLNVPVTFTATGNIWGTNPEFQWTVGGQLMNNNSPTFTTSFTSNQTVTCAVISDANCVQSNTVLSNVISIVATQAASPTLNIQALATVICEGEQITFTASGANWGPNYDLVWKIDGVTKDSNTLSFLTTELLPNQTVTCEVTSFRECLTENFVESNPVAIEVQPSQTPTIQINSNTDVACMGEVVEFSVSGDNWGDNPSFRWKINQQLMETTDVPMFNFTQPDHSFSVTCEVVSSLPCVTQILAEAAPIAVDLLTDDVPTVSISADQTLLCDNAPVTFTADGNNWGAQPTFTWKVDGAVVPNSSSPSTILSVNPGQTVICEVSTLLECSGMTTVNSNSIQVASADFSLQLEELDHEKCGQADGLAEISIQGGIEPYTIEWSNGLSSTFSNNLVSGQYQVTATDANGCEAFVEFTIKNTEGPEIFDLEVEHATCAGSSGKAKVIMMNNSETYGFNWINEDNFIVSKTDTLTNARPGEYTLLVTMASGCATTRTFVIDETVDLEAAIITEEEITLGETVRLDLEVISNTTFTVTWKDSVELGCVNCFNASFTPVATKVYTALITTEGGCTLEVSQMVKVNPVANVYVPNAFSPNQDGYNDYFMLYGNDTQVQAVTSMQVFNRWGAKVFDGSDLNINEEYAGWNGHVNGKVLDAGVYIYIAEVTFIDGHTEILKGDVTLVR